MLRTRYQVGDRSASWSARQGQGAQGPDELEEAAPALAVGFFPQELDQTVGARLPPGSRSRARRPLCRASGSAPMQGFDGSGDGLLGRQASHQPFQGLAAPLLGVLQEGEQPLQFLDQALRMGEFPTVQKAVEHGFQAFLGGAVDVGDWFPAEVPLEAIEDRAFGLQGKSGLAGPVGRGPPGSGQHLPAPGRPRG